jgi:L-methionine (R)-S-oxide reductase
MRRRSIEMIVAEACKQFLARLDRQFAGATDPAATAMKLIAEQFPHYKWVGVYWLKGDNLVLGPYVCAPTEHDVIPVGRGVCGTAVAEGKNQVIADVRELANYLSCSVQTRSEIVVLIRKGGAIVGQIDADGHEVGAFDATDEALLTAVAERIAARLP